MVHFDAVKGPYISFHNVEWVYSDGTPLKNTIVPITETVYNKETRQLDGIIDFSPLTVTGGSQQWFISVIFSENFEYIESGNLRHRGADGIFMEDKTNYFGIGKEIQMSRVDNARGDIV